MMNLNKQSWRTPINFLLALLGFSDAVYLTAVHYNGAKLVCGAFGNCSTVLNSAYSTVLGVPVAILGAIYYFILIILLVLWFDTKKSLYQTLAARLTIVGLLMSLWFLGLQIFILQAFCPFCLLSAATSIGLFIVNIRTISKNL